MSPELRAKIERIAFLRGELNRTDYKTIKYLEGEIGEDEYNESLAQRRAWRDEINTLQAEIKNNRVI